MAVGRADIPAAHAMPTYLYETLPEDPAAAPERFEVKQSMRDAPLTHHPDSGVPVRRVVVGGFAPMGMTKAQKPAPPPAGKHPGGCSCCRH